MLKEMAEERKPAPIPKKGKVISRRKVPAKGKK
jgi:hypothetical protein